MSVMTVTRQIEADELGITLAHEHIFIDLGNQFTEFKDPEKNRISKQKVQMSNLGVLRRNPYAVKDNLLLDDVNLAIEELSYFKNLGGNTIVDCTSMGIRRNPKKLRHVAEVSGLNIVAGSGYYTYDTHPPEMDEWSPKKIAEHIIRDLSVGIDDTAIKAGVIGEIGISNPIHPNEKKSLIASAIAHRETGAAVYVHTFPWGRTGLEAIDILLHEGITPGKIVICHIDVELDMEYLKQLLAKKIFIEFDNFGKEFYLNPSDFEDGFAGGIFARDIERIHIIKQLSNEGYEKQILITNDICLKCMLHHYGGWGYGHILQNIVPMMLHEGISQDTINTFLRNNPRNLLDRRGK